MTLYSRQNFYEIYDLHYDRVRDFIKTVVKEDWIAEDLTQDTFLRAFSCIETLRDNSKLKAWLFRIAHNLCKDYFRIGKKASERATRLEDRFIVPGQSKPERSLEQREMSTCVQNHFQLLPETLRPVLWLYDIAGFHHKEIAEILDISVENVKVRLHRARKKMKSILMEKCSFERDDRNVLVCEPKKTDV